MDRNIVKRAKELDINISAAAERGIINYIKEIESIGESVGRRLNKSNNSYAHNKEQKSENIDKQNKNTPRPEFESESLARQARMIGHYTTRANIFFVRG